MVEIEIDKTEIGSLLNLAGNFLLSLSYDEYKELILVPVRQSKEEIYYMQYKGLKCKISSETAQKLIDIGVPVSDVLPY